MNYLKILLKYFLYSIISIVIFGFILTIFYYFNILNTNIYNILKMVGVLLSLFINSFLLGKKSLQHGLVEGLKLGGLFLIVVTILSFITNMNFGFRSFLYAVIILLTTSVGAVIGINKKAINNL